MIEIMISNSRQDESYQIEMQSYLCEVLLILIRGFKQKSSRIEKLDTDDLRIRKIVDYLERNYQQAITLEDLANKSYLSTGYLSRYFKQKMGMGFTRFLNTVRLNHSIKDLLYTDDTISQISMNNGFANTKSFTNLFKEVYGVTPNVYREHNSKEKIDSFQNISIEDTKTIINSSDVLAKLGNMLTKHEQVYRNTKSRFEELQIELNTPLNLKLPRPKHDTYYS